MFTTKRPQEGRAEGRTLSFKHGSTKNYTPDAGQIFSVGYCIPIKTLFVGNCVKKLRDK
jgi:hypothetical protein